MTETLDKVKQRISQLERVVAIAKENEYDYDTSLIPEVQRLLSRALFILDETDALIFAILKPMSGRRTSSCSNLKEKD